jgi:hypothetical protein
MTNYRAGMRALLDGLKRRLEQHCRSIERLAPAAGRPT